MRHTEYVCVNLCSFNVFFVYDIWHTFVPALCESGMLVPRVCIYKHAFICMESIECFSVFSGASASRLRLLSRNSDS